jgi:hypothetical protein
LRATHGLYYLRATHGLYYLRATHAGVRIHADAPFWY